MSVKTYKNHSGHVGYALELVEAARVELASHQHPSTNSSKLFEHLTPIGVTDN